MLGMSVQGVVWVLLPIIGVWAMCDEVKPAEAAVEAKRTGSAR